MRRFTDLRNVHITHLISSHLTSLHMNRVCCAATQFAVAATSQARPTWFRPERSCSVANRKSCVTHARGVCVCVCQGRWWQAWWDSRCLAIVCLETRSTRPVAWRAPVKVVNQIYCIYICYYELTLLDDRAAQSSAPVTTSAPCGTACSRTSCKN